MQYLGYDESRSVPNVVVDGAANESTVLTLSHWPGAPTPPALARDVSAEIAFAYLDDPHQRVPVDVVTNNHFDVDGLVSLFVLTEPDRALSHRDLLVDLAEAGDFSRYRDRRAARAAMAFAALSAEENDDCTYGEHTDRLYRELLPRVLDVLLDNDSCRDLWADEDAQLAASEAALADGRITIEERPEIDLAIVKVGDGVTAGWGHVIGERQAVPVHPMALHNATGCFRVLTLHGRRYSFADRYETWVQYRSRPTLPRVDMAPLAAELTGLETGGVTWTAGDPGAITPTMATDGESPIAPDDVITAVDRFLREAGV